MSNYDEFIKRTNEVYALSWDDEIDVAEADASGSGFKIPAAGDYDFTVVTFERRMYDGSEKIPACNYAAIGIELYSANGALAGRVHENFYLVSSQTWKIMQFFTALGMRSHGEAKFKPDWQGSIGRSGKCKIAVRKSSQGKEFANVDRYYEPLDAAHLDMQSKALHPERSEGGAFESDPPKPALPF
ncbi:MAG: hypothetical protein FWG30_11565 [Eubacteriaceae bacterium]|nr:hypothetical protein [Eubacteriaceae bacterium]